MISCPRSECLPKSASGRLRSVRAMASAAGESGTCHASDNSFEGSPRDAGSEKDSMDGISILNDSFPAHKSSIINMSFAGCGFLGIYHLGAATTFQKHGKSFLHQVDRFAGASAGALVASVLAIKGDDTEILKVRTTLFKWFFNLKERYPQHSILIFKVELYDIL